MTRKLDLVSGDNADTSDLATQIDALRAEMTKLASSVSDMLAKSSSGLSAKVAHNVEKTAAQASTLASEFTSHSMENLAAASDKAKDASLQIIDAISAEVRKNPGRTLAITLGLGMILGLMARSQK